MTVAINYDLGKNPNSSREVFGMQVAVFDWFKAFFRYGSQEKIYLLVGNTNALEEIRSAAHTSGFDPQRLVALDRRFVEENYTHFSVIFRPDPLADRLFWQRQQVSGPGYAFCGLAHAISGIETGQVLEEYCLSPTFNSDAIICPSRAVRSAIRNFWDLYADYLNTHFSSQYRCPVELPIIPLGVDIDRIESLTTPDKRKQQRETLGLSDDDIVLLWVGRMSHAIKGHPIAMFHAAEQAALLTGASVHLVMYGYFIPGNAEPQFVKLAADICKTAKVTFISNEDPRFPNGAWASGDIFLSLVDNMQESFGLTPLEAMAAGLPRVISDWNGYRESVTHGEDGFLVPTLQPPGGNGDALTSLLLSGREMYGGFLAKTALSVAVDFGAAAIYISLLIQNKALRQNMAEKARHRVKNNYHWKNIIPAYEQLWHELSTRRRQSHTKMGIKKYASVLPQCPDPFTMYASFPTAPLKETDTLCVRATPTEVKLLWEHDINTFGLDVMIPPNEVTSVMNYIMANRDIPIATVFAQFPGQDPSALWRTLGWLIKLGILSHKSS